MVMKKATTRKKPAPKTTPEKAEAAKPAPRPRDRKQVGWHKGRPRYEDDAS